MDTILYHFANLVQSFVVEYLTQSLNAKDGNREPEAWGSLPELRVRHTWRETFFSSGFKIHQNKSLKFLAQSHLCKVKEE